MAKRPDLSSTQKKIVDRYYQNKESLNANKLGELVSDLYLALDDDKKSTRLWKQAATALKNLGVQPAEVERTARSLFSSGFREIVLTGVNTGDYGRDFDPPTDLEALLRRLLETCGPNRIRLNSLEPLTVTDGIIKLMAAEPRLAPHLQVPLQSGSASLLRRMRRNYRLEQYAERLERLRSALPWVGLGADVIVGFPGETDELFEQTHKFIASSPLNYLHVFAWSPRPGTPASELPDRPDAATVRIRSARLRSLAAEAGLRFRRSFEGERLDAVVLGESRDGKRVRALTGNFIEVSLPAGAAECGELVSVRLLSAHPEECRAVVEGIPAWAASAGQNGA